MFTTQEHMTKKGVSQMLKVELHRDQLPVEEVFAFLSDLENNLGVQGRLTKKTSEASLVWHNVPNGQQRT
jgi:hypothetical protein